MAAELRIPTPLIDIIENDITNCEDRVREVVNRWKHREGSSATLGNLANAFVRMEKPSIAQKLISKSLST